MPRFFDGTSVARDWSLERPFFSVPAGEGERETAVRRSISERSAQTFEAEADKLDGWADDLKLGLEREIKELDRQIKEARRGATVAVSLEEKLAAQKRMKALESERNQKRRTLFDAQDEIDHKRGELISQLEMQLTQKVPASSVRTMRPYPRSTSS